MSKTSNETVGARVEREADFFHPTQLAKYLGISVLTVYSWVRRRQGPPVIKVSSRCCLFKRADVDAWLVSRTVAPAESRHAKPTRAPQRRPVGTSRRKLGGPRKTQESFVDGLVKAAKQEVLK